MVATNVQKTINWLHLSCKALPNVNLKLGMTFTGIKIWQIYQTRESCELWPPESCHSQSFEAHPPCSSIQGWCRNDQEWRDGKLDGLFRGPSHPVILGPVQSFQTHPCHSGGMGTQVIPSHPISFLAMGWGIFKDNPTDHDIYAWNDLEWLRMT